MAVKKLFKESNTIRLIVCIGMAVLSLTLFTACSEDNGSSEALEKTGDLYELNLDLSCNENLFFSRYDIEVYIDDEEIGILDHGSEKQFYFDLNEGNHTFRVVKDGSSSVDGSMDFVMPAEKAVLVCELNCTSDQVEIEDFSVKTPAQIEENRKKQEEQEEREEAEKAAKEKAEQEAREKADAEAAAQEKADAAERERQREKEEAEEAARKAEEAAGPVSESTAKLFTSRWGEVLYPYGFKLHYLLDVLNAERQSDGSIFLKIKCDVKNEYGTWMKGLVCEAVVGGTEGNPEMISFDVY